LVRALLRNDMVNAPDPRWIETAQRYNREAGSNYQNRLGNEQPGASVTQGPADPRWWIALLLPACHE
jgi:hypothetical protein